MKVSYFLSAAIATAAMMGTAGAAVPDPTADLNTCLAWANGGAAATARCYALDDCNKTNSDNEGDWKGCISRVEVAYNDTLQGIPVPQGGAGAVVTSPAASDYEMRATEGEKGFKTSDEGRGL